jgi:hypothetical protein
MAFSRHSVHTGQVRSIPVLASYETQSHGSGFSFAAGKAKTYLFDLNNKRAFMLSRALWMKLAESRLFDTSESVLSSTLNPEP